MQHCCTHSIAVACQHSLIQALHTFQSRITVCFFLETFSIIVTTTTSQEQKLLFQSKHHHRVPTCSNAKPALVIIIHKNIFLIVHSTIEPAFSTFFYVTTTDRPPYRTSHQKLRINVCGTVKNVTSKLITKEYHLLLFITMYFLPTSNFAMIILCPFSTKKPCV